LGEDSDQRFDQWMQTATRYFVLCNAGGAVAVLGFIGASLGSGCFPKIAVLSLLCFVAGLVVAGFVILGQLAGAYRSFLTDDIDPVGADESIKRSWVTRITDWVEPRTGHFLASAFMLFIIGAVIGLIALAAW
jgi:hypothetical protein